MGFRVTGEDWPQKSCSSDVNRMKLPGQLGEILTRCTQACMYDACMNTWVHACVQSTHKLSKETLSVVLELHSEALVVSLLLSRPGWSRPYSDLPVSASRILRLLLLLTPAL